MTRLSEGRVLARRLAEGIGEKAGVDPEAILGRSRTADVSDARRHLFLALWQADYSVADVARICMRHHTTVLHGLKRILGKDGYEEQAKLHSRSRG